jgi:DNA invertase Pin-like site-specific DNA recombinase
MKAFLYARVSTKNQLDSLERQKKELIEYAEKHGYEYKLFSEIACGAELDLFESEHKKLFREIERGNKPDAVIVTSLDRFGRDTLHLLNSIHKLEEQGIKFISIKENLDTSSRIGKFLLHVLSAVAEMERELIRERLQKGYEEARKKGKVGRKRKKIDEKALIEYYKKGVSYSSLAKMFDCSVGTIINRIRKLKEEGKL